MHQKIGEGNNMSDGGRRCIVKNDLGDYEARFIKFCQSVVYDGYDRAVGVERALVEKDDGQVCCVSPQSVRFIK